MKCPLDDYCIEDVVGCNDCPGSCYKLNDDQTCPLKTDDGEKLTKCPNDDKCLTGFDVYCSSRCPGGCYKMNDCLL